ncbi:E3 SUMO-protein ligase ZBED1-like [Misgurnus anguillicaudatus]|uniref:E3 SUMO-protein ligase ZBED1-like n=1 Tax=Misgurnus anguillicaudatus TaxID=75329 RepID=UPI003CCF9F63
MERKKRSKAWLYFTKRDENHAVCNNCKAVISCKGANTSNMLKHMLTHGTKLQECRVFDPLRTTAQASSTVTSIEKDDRQDEIISSQSTGCSSNVTSEEMRSPFTLAAMGRKLNDEKVNECHRAVTRFVVKGLHPFSTVDQPDFREMIRTINPRYKPPSRDYLSNSLIPAWYQVEKENLLSAVKDVTKAAITADGWTSLAQDHYLTVTLHYTRQGTTVGKVLKTKAVYEAQTGDAVAEEVEAMLKEFEVREKVVAATVDNAANMDVAVKKMQVLKISCFAHTLNLAAQKINKCSIVCNWSARVL